LTGPVAATNGAVIEVFVVVEVMVYVTKMLLPLMQGTGIVAAGVEPVAGVGVLLAGVPALGESFAPAPAGALGELLASLPAVGVLGELPAPL
jgi:hypothetical protein